MPHFRLLALDIDGTLVNSRDELTPATHAALRRATDAGVRVVLATGRRYSRALPLVERLEIDAPLVTASGALVKRPSDHNTLHRAEFAPGVLEQTLAIVERAGYDAVLYGDTFHDGFDFYVPRIEVDTQPELAEYFALNPECHRVWPQMMRSPPPEIFAGFAVGSRPAMVELDRVLQAELPEVLYTHVIRSPRYQGHMCEIAPVGATKWSGIQRLAESWEIDPAEICAVGDDVNDIPMIEAAGLGVAMGNAVAETKAIANRIAPTHDQDGLVEVVNWLLT